MMGCSRYRRLDCQGTQSYGMLSFTCDFLGNVSSLAKLCRRGEEVAKVVRHQLHVGHQLNTEVVNTDASGIVRKAQELGQTVHV